MVIVLAALAYFFPLVPALEHVSAWLGGLGVIGAALFAVVIAISSLCLLPASPFIIAAAAVFGFSLGLLTSSVGIILGASSGYFLSRLFLRKDLADQLKERPTFKAIDQAIAEEGWKIVLLLRLCPIPFGLANYLYGLTAVRFRPYLIATMLGGLPSTLLFCQLGSEGKAGLDALSSGHLGRSTGELVVLGLSMVATVFAIVLIPLFARRAVSKYTQVSLPSSASL